ncbi:MAG: class I SAM-dependent methyltransferase [Dehalococcoidia bacterium]|nr:class I SAM-dependent methyltransferase [Dehalococcoidia bacterium]
MANDSTRWNAEVYERIGTPMRRWAQAVIADLELRGDETVLDAGCGSGSVTFDLLERLPRGRIYAVDSSPEMIEKLSAAVRERGETRVVPLLADLTDFALPEPVDCVFSNAVLHWIPDDDALFACLFRAAKPGGRFRAQCGGAGNIARLMAATDAVCAREPFSRYLEGSAEFRKYRAPEQAQEAMARAGWTEVRATLFAAPVRFGQTPARLGESREDAALYLRTIILQRHVAALPEALRDPFLRAVIEESAQTGERPLERKHSPPFTADYVRLDLWARRPAA